MRKRWIAVTLSCVMALASILTLSGESVIYAAHTDTRERTEEAKAGQERQAEQTVGTEEAKETQKEETREIKETEGREGTHPSDGLLPPQEHILLSLDETRMYGYGQDAGLKAAAAVNSEWDKYTSRYFYNQMRDSEKKFYDSLDTMCLEYLTTNKNADYNHTTKEYCTEAVSAKSLTKEQAANVISIFHYSNPQYYFLKNGWYGSVYGETRAFGLVVYPGFADGKTRAKATAAVRAQAEQWQKQIDALDSQEQKAKLIHDLIIQKVDYNYDIYKFDLSSRAGQTAQFEWENTAYSQTAYSVFCTDLTVCAGYAQAYEMMCNSSGIDSVAVTSTGHEWNKVRVNDSWYNVDCTWDDAGGSGVRYDFFARSDFYYDTGPKSASHIEESLWNGYLPLCTLDSGSTMLQAGTFPPISSVTAAPVIKGIADGDGKMEVTITSATPGAVIYYTLDGTKPSVGATKSTRYRNSFYVRPNTTVKAVAVCDAYRDSAVTSAKMKNVSERQTAYKIVYRLNGGKNHKNNPASYKKTTKTIKLKNPTRTGYTFRGWYSDSKFKKKVTEIKKGSAGKKTLYAKWEANKYTVKFNGNGAASGKMSALTGRIYEKPYQLPANKFKKRGYTFQGWNTKKNGRGKSFRNKQKVKNLTAKRGGTVILYAQWKKK